MNTLKTGSAALAIMALLNTAACDNASAVQTRERAEGETAQSAGLVDASTETAAASGQAAKPALTASRRETVDAKIARLYERNGADFAARSPEDYLAKVEAFTAKPPSGTETVKRPNGDTLYYQASTNTFAVVDRNGVPRTMFKPDEGAAYWDEQKSRLARQATRRSGDNGES